MRPLMEMRMIVANKSFADACAQYCSNDSTQLKAVSMVPHLNLRNKQSSVGQKYSQKHSKTLVSPWLTKWGFKLKVQIVHVFLKICHEFGNGIMKYLQNGQVQAIGRRQDCTKFRTPQRCRQLKQIELLWSLKPRAVIVTDSMKTGCPAERRSVVPHMLGSCTGVKAKPLPEQCQVTQEDFIVFWMTPACHLNVPRITDIYRIAQRKHDPFPTCLRNIK